MSKEEFLNGLEVHLHVLNDQERKDVLEEYAQHINMKIESGLSEEEAVRDFGDPGELIAELLDAYHINSELASETVAADTGTKQDSLMKGLKDNAGRTVGHAAKGAVSVLYGVTGGCGKMLQACLKTAKNLAVFLWKGLKAFAGWFGELFLSIWHFFTGMFKSIGTLFRRKEKHPERSADSLSTHIVRGCTGFFRWCGRVCRGCLRLCLKACLFCWKFCLVMTAVPFLVFGAFVLLLAGFLAVMVLQRYPVAGMTVMVLGMTACSFGSAGLLLSYVFGRKKTAAAGEAVKPGRNMAEIESENDPDAAEEKRDGDSETSESVLSVREGRES